MELRHLRNFVAIAEERSFTRALDLRLFDRHTRGVELTDAGELFLERALVWRSPSPAPPLLGLIQAASALTHRRWVHPQAPALLAA